MTLPKNRKKLGQRKNESKWKLFDWKNCGSWCMVLQRTLTQYGWSGNHVKRNWKSTHIMGAINSTLLWSGQLSKGQCAMENLLKNWRTINYKELMIHSDKWKEKKLKRRLLFVYKPTSKGSFESTCILLNALSYTVEHSILWHKYGWP